MICHYCNEYIDPLMEEWAAMKDIRTEEVIELHYPHCRVRFGTFHKTKKELEQLGVLKP